MKECSSRQQQHSGAGAGPWGGVGSRRQEGWRQEGGHGRRAGQATVGASHDAVFLSGCWGISSEDLS